MMLILLHGWLLEEVIIIIKKYLPRNKEKKEWHRLTIISEKIKISQIKKLLLYKKTIQSYALH